MKPGFTALGYRSFLRRMYEKVHEVSVVSPWKGRLLSLPMALMLLVTIPIEKTFSFLEAFFFTLANLFAPLYPKYCSYHDAWISLKRTGIYLIGVIFSPITALLAASAVLVSMINNPAGASKKFADSCKG